MKHKEMMKNSYGRGRKKDPKTTLKLLLLRCLFKYLGCLSRVVFGNFCSTAVCAT